MTSLPLDYSRRPWKPKYVTSETEVFNYWFKFGTYSDGTVGISDGNADVIARVPVEVADEIIGARNVFCDLIEKHFCNFGEKQ